MQERRSIYVIAHCVADMAVRVGKLAEQSLRSGEYAFFDHATKASEYFRTLIQ